MRLPVHLAAQILTTTRKAAALWNTSKRKIRAQRCTIRQIVDMMTWTRGI
jgi:hypothetical protein